MDIKNNITSFAQNLPAYIKLIAVSKTQPIETILEAYRAGHRLFGENKVQELVSKYDALPKDIEWHMIGHLQSNKVKFIAPFIHLIHSVDSLKLLQEISRQGQKVNRTIKCLLQLHIATEETKFGFSENEVIALVQSGELEKLKNIRIEGVMGMATFSEDSNQIRSEFRTLSQFFNRLKTTRLPEQAEMNELSIGMSADYKIAIEEGSTMVRVGTAIFGERKS